MNTLKKNFMYNLSYQLLTFMIPLITTPYLSRVLGAEGIGDYSYTSSIAYYFVMFGLLGLENYGNRTIASVRNDKQELSKNFWNIYTMQIIISLFVIIIYCVFIYFKSKNRLMLLIQLIYVISVLFNINWFFFGMEKFKLTVLRNSFIKIVSVILIFIFVKTSKDVYIYAFIMSGSLLISNLVLLPYLHKYVYFVTPCFYEIIHHIKPNLKLFIPILAVSLYKVMDKTMLGTITSNIEVGYYENTEKITQIPVAIVSSIGVVMLPRVSNLVNTVGFKNCEQELDKSIKIAMFFSCSIGFGIMGISNCLVPIFFGEGFEKCVMLLKIITPSCILMSLSSVIRMQYLIPLKKDNIYIISTVIGAMINFAVNLCLIDLLASIGAALGTVLAELCVLFVQLYMMKNIKIIRYLKHAFPFFASGILMYLLLELINIFIKKTFLNLVIQIIIGIIFYFLILGSFMFIKKIYKKLYSIDN